MCSEYLSQGQLLLTPSTKHWGGKRIIQAQEEEAKMAFTNFRVQDSGKSRIFIKRFNTAEECVIYINDYNSKIRKLKKVK